MERTTDRRDTRPAERGDRVRVWMASHPGHPARDQGTAGVLSIESERALLRWDDGSVSTALPVRCLEVIERRCEACGELDDNLDTNGPVRQYDATCGDGALPWSHPQVWMHADCYDRYIDEGSQG